MFGFYPNIFDTLKYQKYFNKHWGTLESIWEDMCGGGASSQYVKIRSHYVLKNYHFICSKT